MKILFTKNNKFWSKVLMWTFEESVSHVALEFEHTDLIIESSSHGVKIKRKKYFIDRNTPHMVVNIPCSSVTEMAVFNDVLDHLEGKKYDYNAYFWLGLLGFRRKFFGIPLPNRNIAESGDGYLCTEILGPILHFLSHRGYNLYHVDLAIMTPYALYKELSERYQGD